MRPVVASPLGSGPTVPVAPSWRSGGVFQPQGGSLAAPIGHLPPQSSNWSPEVVYRNPRAAALSSCASAVRRRSPQPTTLLDAETAVRRRSPQLTPQEAAIGAPVAKRHSTGLSTPQRHIQNTQGIGGGIIGSRSWVPPTQGASLRSDASWLPNPGALNTNAVTNNSWAIGTQNGLTSWPRSVPNAGRSGLSPVFQTPGTAPATPDGSWLPPSSKGSIASTGASWAPPPQSSPTIPNVLSAPTIPSTATIAGSGSHGSFGSRMPAPLGAVRGAGGSGGSSSLAPALPLSPISMPVPPVAPSPVRMCGGGSSLLSPSVSLVGIFPSTRIAQMNSGSSTLSSAMPFVNPQNISVPHNTLPIRGASASISLATAQPTPPPQDVECQTAQVRTLSLDARDLVEKPTGGQAMGGQMTGSETKCAEPKDVPTAQYLNPKDRIQTATALVPNHSGRISELENKIKELQQELDQSGAIAASDPQLEKENAWLREQIRKLSTKNQVTGAFSDCRNFSAIPAPGISDSADPRERAICRLQGAVRNWLARTREPRFDDASFARERWNRTLREVEGAVHHALEVGLGQAGMGRVPRQTRLRLLANALKQGVLKVNQAMMHQTLQEMRKSSPVPASPNAESWLVAASA